MSQPRVAVVTPYYNRRDHVLASVQSLVDQTYPDTIVVVVDDGSTDDTWDVLQAFAGLPNVKLIRQHNQGLSAALNNGIRAVECDYVAIHGSGDISHPTRIEKQVRALEERPGTVIVGSLFDNSESPNARFQRLLADPHPDFFTQLTRGDMLVHGSMMFRRATFDAVGGYRSFYKYAQDFDLKLRFSEHGGSFIVPEVLYVRRKLDDSVNADHRKSLIQEYFNDMALQSAYSRRRTGIDLVDQYGAQAAFLRRPSHFLGRRLSSAGLRWRVTRDGEAGLHYLQAARHEKLSLRQRIVVALGSLPDDSFAWRRVVKPLLHIAYEGVARSRQRNETAAQRRAVAG